jgi:predicted secreted protein
MTSALSSFGTLLKIGDGGNPTETFTTIAEVKDIKGPGLELSTEEVTNHSSTGGWKEYVATLLDAGEVSFDMNFIPTSATQSQTSGLVKDMKNKTLRNFKLVFPDNGNTTWSFSAYVTKFEVDEPVEGILGASCTLKITGQPTLAG